VANLTTERFQVCSARNLAPLIFNRFVEHFFWVEILLSRTNYAHKIVVHEGALLPEQNPGAKPRSKTPRVYHPLQFRLNKRLQVAHTHAQKVTSCIK